LSDKARLAGYLSRLGLAAPPEATPEGAAALQAAHREAITFENLDVLLRRPIAVDGAAVYAKLIENGRGGYCFEQNRLYADMLALLGVPTRPLLGRPRLALPEGFIGPRTHILLLAEFAGEPWILDAGFGGAFVPPMPLVDGAVAETPDGARHRLRRIGQDHAEWLLERAGARGSTDGRYADHSDWQGQYSFDLAPVMAMDIEQANHWTATWPQSRFLSEAIVTRVLPGGFASLIGRKVTVTRNGTSEVRELASVAEW
jgi:N-hydroxyarylamine O-acetyltransferase